MATDFAAPRADMAQPRVGVSSFNSHYTFFDIRVMMIFSFYFILFLFVDFNTYRVKEGRTG